MSRARKQPSESYEARARRGRPQVTISMSEDVEARLRALAAHHGEPLGTTIERLLSAYRILAELRRRV